MGRGKDQYSSRDLAPATCAGLERRERPILFPAPMVRALLDGRKTQARWALKVQPFGSTTINQDCVTNEWGYHWYTTDDRGDPTVEHWRDLRCPYGAPGDLLWVRETHALIWPDAFEPEDIRHCRPEYRADTNGRCLPGEWPDECRGDPECPRWRPSTHMPRWASRLTLRVTDARVERVQDISEADAAAEGVEPPATEREDRDWSICPACGGSGLHGSLGDHLGYVEVDCTECETLAKRYRHLWEHINGPGSWDANPWVWAVSFEVVRPESGTGPDAVPGMTPDSSHPPEAREP